MQEEREGRTFGVCTVPEVGVLQNAALASFTFVGNPRIPQKRLFRARYLHGHEKARHNHQHRCHEKGGGHAHPSTSADRSVGWVRLQKVRVCLVFWCLFALLRGTTYEDVEFSYREACLPQHCWCRTQNSSIDGEPSTINESLTSRSPTRHRLSTGLSPLRHASIGPAGPGVPGSFFRKTHLQLQERYTTNSFRAAAGVTEVRCVISDGEISLHQNSRMHAQQTTLFSVSEPSG